MTIIRVGTERWDVPIGFGAAYARIANEPCEPRALRGILGLVGFDVPESVVSSWTLRQRVEARSTLRASTRRRATIRSSGIRDRHGCPSRGGDRMVSRRR